MLKVLDLFSGIGGFSLGLERTGGFKTVGFCEIDQYCQKVLRKHWPEVPIHDDINTLNAKEIYNGRIDVITGGYPCQPFSVAGNRQGHEDDRHLWPRMFEIIKQERPTWIICENVNGHITMGLDEVLLNLESEGYSSKPFVIPACSIDAPHRRDRVWIVSNLQSNGLQRGPEHRNPESEGEEANEQFAGCSSFRTMANTTSSNDRSSNREKEGGQESKPRNSSSKDWNIWPIEPNVGRVANGVSRRMDRIRGLGNAVVPGIVTKIGKAILDFK